MVEPHYAAVQQTRKTPCRAIQRLGSRNLAKIGFSDDDA
jgi:hypothetical protein